MQNNANDPPPVSTDEAIRQYQRSRARLRALGSVDYSAVPDFDRDPKVPNEQEMEKMVDNTYKLLERHKIFSDETKYFSQNYKIKRRDLEKTLNTFMDELWKEVPAPHLRLEYTNVLNFVATIREFFASICESADEEEWSIPTEIIDRFTDYIDVIHQCRRYTFVDLKNFMEALNMCDDIMKALQTMRRVRSKLINNETPQYIPYGTDRYTPYDYEWFCGNVISGPYQLSCVKWLCASRYNQAWLTSFRCDAMAVMHETFFDYLTQVPVPLPEEPDNAKQLLQALNSRDVERKEANAKSLKRLKELMGDDTELEFTRITADFSALRADIRRKKRNVAELIVRCDRSACISYYLILTTLSRVEAELLMLHKAFAPYMHTGLGMFGKSMPSSVFKICWQIFVITNEKNCKELPLNPEIETLLLELRKECRAQIKKFQEEYDVMCESYIAGRFSFSIFQQYNDFPYKIEVSDFPDEVDYFAQRMIDNLTWEQFELERLNHEFAYVKQGVFDGWPREGQVCFRINTFKPFLVSFYCNFALMYPPAFAHRVLELNTMTFTSRIEAEHFWGNMILQDVNTVIDEAKCVPSISEITQEMSNMIKAEIDEDCDLEGLTVTELAGMVSDIVNSHIAASGFRAKYPVPKGTAGTAATAKKLAQTVTKTFMEYKQAQQYEVLKKRLAPKTKKQALEAARNSQWSVITQLDEIHQEILRAELERMERRTSESYESDDESESAFNPYTRTDLVHQEPFCQEMFEHIMSTGVFGSEVPMFLIEEFVNRVYGVIGFNKERDFSDMNDSIYNVDVD